MGAYVGDCDGIRGQDVIVYRKAGWGRINVGEGARIVQWRSVEIEGTECRTERDGKRDLTGLDCCHGVVKYENRAIGSRSCVK